MWGHHHTDPPLLRAGPDYTTEDVEAASTLLLDPIVLEQIGDEDAYANGQHRVQAMRDQRVTNVILQRERPVDSASLPGELRTVNEASEGD